MISKKIQNILLFTANLLSNLIKNKANKIVQRPENKKKKNPTFFAKSVCGLFRKPYHYLLLQ